MFKRVKVVLLACILVLFQVAVVAAASAEVIGDVESRKEGDNQGVYVEDETVVVYNTKAVNGGICLSKQEENKAALIKKEEQALRAINYPTAKTLNYTFQTQINNYYCGPAAARIVLSTIGVYKTQQTLGRLLGTTTNGTNAGPHIAYTLNNLASGTGYTFAWVWHNASNISTLVSHFKTSIYNGNGIMVNSWESAGETCIRGHEAYHNVDLYHFGAVTGYYNSGNQFVYVDPGHGRFTGFVKYQTITKANISNALGGRGYVW